MAVIISELERTGAFDPQGACDRPDDWHRLDRSGRGAVDRDDVQRRHRDRSASQYSYLPSWISFLATREKSVDSGG